MKNELHSIIEKLSKLKIKLDCVGNYPWIYLYKVNNNSVKEKFYSDHAFTIAFYKKNGDVELTDTSKIFKMIRKYR